MKVLITDGLEKEGLEYLVKEGINVTEKKVSEEELLNEIPNYNALIVRSATKVNMGIIETGYQGKLEIIGRSGVGVDNIDVNAATERGIVVKFAPSGATNSVSELTIGMMLDISRKITSSSNAMKKGKWAKSNGYELNGKTLGIIGCGRIGRKVSYIAKHGFDMKVIGYDKYPNAEAGIEFTNLEKLIETSDYITLNIPKEKNPVISYYQINKMKKNAYLIDVSRGGNVDENALYEALKEKIIAGAAKDVFVREGKKFEEDYNTKSIPLLELENFLPLPHLGASTYEGQLRTGTEMARVISAYLKDGDMCNAVNMGEKKGYEGEGHRISIHHEDVPGIFGKIGSVFGKYGINIYKQPSDVLKNGKVLTRYIIEKPISNEAMSEIKSLNGIYRVSGLKEEN